MTSEYRIQIPESFDFIWQPSRYKIVHGGRGKGSSWNFARALLVKGLQSPLRILCCREYQASMGDSVIQLLDDQIGKMGMRNDYDVQRKQIIGRYGTKFMFEGIAQNVTKIKSTEGVDVAWVEEGEKVTNNSWEVLIPTIRKPNSEIWVGYNPDQEDDPTHQRFVINTPDDAIVKAMSWRDNPWFPDVLRKEMEYLRRVDYDAYLHVWEGQCREITDAQVLKDKYCVEAFEFPDQEEFYYGADWGFSVDPTALIKTFIREKTLYIMDEFYEVGCELDHLPGKFRTVPGADEYEIIADSARPETISYMKRQGFRIRGCKKWSGKKQDEIAFLRKFERIVIHPRCKNTIQEAKLWSYKTDSRTGAVLPKLLDKHDHTWEAIGNALNDLITNTETDFIAL